ncbi:putative ubiquitin hydrolase [Trypanosoma rangeli]|uniref:ubiquitinyl hydrolase 1 n=1 Tax=Trypanosoma rangeli TaxID=5698 RepID=A0A3R7MM20_TRYRA|nr:putative ubiquitin hydrolase [Trypanosoma rangeli]RNF08291.1 putative ubiquitin hydrolase [Trypanosoma rangeli]|eukprot:RNF08291.1 putative ubiquitin hydrolase [Trypanosoma rangeli]
MNYGRKVLEAEKLRTETDNSYALNGDNGYLKHNQAFPLAHGNYTTPPRRSHSRADVGDGDSSDGDYTKEIERANDGGNSCGVGTGTKQPHQRHQFKGSSNGMACGQSRKRKSSASRSLTTSPVPKKIRLEATSPAKGDTRSSLTRATGSPAARRSLLGVSEKKSPVAGGGAVETASRYAAPCLGNSNGGNSPCTTRMRGSHYAAPTISSKLKETLSWRRSSLTLGLHPPAKHFDGHEPATAGISLSKTSRNHAIMADPYDAEANKRVVATGEECGQKTQAFSTTINNNNSTASASLFPAYKSAGTSLTQNSTPCTAHPTTSPVKMAKQHVPGSPPPTPAERETVKTPGASPPLRAAVSPHSLSPYRQYRLASEPPQSVAWAAPAYTGKAPYAVAAVPPSHAEEAACDVRRKTYQPLSLSSDTEKGPDFSSASCAKTSRWLLNSSWGAYGSPSLSLGSRHCSGFINPRNDCYACSVLTLLLRSPKFCHALCDAPRREPSDSANRNSTNDNQSYDPNNVHTSWPSIQFQQRQETSFTSIHEVLLHFLRLLQKPESIGYGIDMTPLRGFFSTSFFSGEQQDAHEFFLDLIQKLEEEAIEILKRRNGIHEDSLEKNQTETEAEADMLFNDGNQVDGKGGEDASIIHPSCVWINRLFGGNLLNIIRCGNEACKHEIATQDPYVNLCINLSKTESTEAGATLLAQPLVADNGGSALGEAVGGRPCTPPKEAVRESLPSAIFKSNPGEHVDNDVQTLLEQTLQYVPLDRYVCDACGSTQKQNQGGSLLGPLPPILTIQLNRYSTNYDPVNGVHVIKNKTPVFINEELTLFALREEGQFDGEKKQLAPCVRGAERAAKERERHVIPNQQHEGGETGMPSTNSTLEGDDDSNNSGVDKRHEKAEEEAGDDAKTHINAIRYLYRLRGVVRHIGSCPVAGHYVTEFATDGLEPGPPPKPDDAGSSIGKAEVKPSRLWHIADDIRVELLQLAALERRRSCSTDSYLLLYEKVMEEEVSCPVWRVLPSVRR